MGVTTLDQSMLKTFLLKFKLTIIFYTSITEQIVTTAIKLVNISRTLELTDRIKTQMEDEDRTVSTVNQKVLLHTNFVYTKIKLSQIFLKK